MISRKPRSLEFTLSLYPDCWKSNYCRRKYSAKLPIDYLTIDCLNFDISVKGRERLLQRYIPMLTAKKDHRTFRTALFNKRVHCINSVDPDTVQS